MDPDARSGWIGLAAVTVGLILLLGDAATSGDWGLALVAAPVLVLVGIATSPLFPFLHTPEVETADLADDDVIVYWKPGCTVCWRLLLSLDRPTRRHTTWVNVWRDPTAATTVRNVQDGDLLTPTGMTGDGRIVRGEGVRHLTKAAVEATVPSP